MSGLDEFWTPEPIQAWRLVLADQVGRRSGVLMRAAKVDPYGPPEPARCLIYPGVDRTQELGWYQPRHSPDQVPDMDCDCGWYAWKTAELAHKHSNELEYLNAHKEVELWNVEMFGAVIEHELGYRSRFVRYVDKVASFPIGPPAMKGRR